MIVNNNNNRNITTKVSRDNILDVAKGIAIILVVIGHCYSKDNIVLILIYAFHMPAFFIISGIIYGRKSIAQLSLEKQAKRLLLPYVIFGFGFGLMITFLNHPEGFISTIGYNGLQIICLKGISVEWYLPCIFLTETLFYFVFKYLKPYCDYLNVLLVIMMFLVVCLFMNNHLIIVQRVIIGYTFFSIGVYLSQFSRKIFPTFIYILMSLVFVILSYYNGMVSLVTMTLGNPIIYVINGILGTLLLIRLSAMLCEKREKSFNCISKKIAYVGQSTLVILCTHMFYIEILRLLDYKLFNNTFKTFWLFEGPVLGLIVLALVMPVIPHIKKVLYKII